MAVIAARFPSHSFWQMVGAVVNATNSLPLHNLRPALSDVMTLKVLLSSSNKHCLDEFLPSILQLSILFRDERKMGLGPVVRKPINANPRLKVNRGFHLAS